LVLAVLALVLLRHKQQQNFHLPFPLLALELPLELPLAWALVLLQHKQQQNFHLVLVAPLLAVLVLLAACLDYSAASAHQP
jgi:hypothetical protein